MGLIKKQAGVDLNLKIEEWIKKDTILEKHLKLGHLTITPDHRIVPDYFNDCDVVKAIVKTKGDIPEYIMFDFGNRTNMPWFHLPWYREDIVENLNKCDKHLMGLDKCRAGDIFYTLYFLERKDGKWISAQIRC